MIYLRFFKWKLAFHYQNKNDISIIPVFTREPLQMYAQSVGIYKNNMTMTDLYLTIKNKEKYGNLENAISLAEIIWEEFQNFSTSLEKARIEHSNLTTSQKTNATSSLDCIEYEIKAHKITRKNPHNHLERSFYSFLNNIKAQNIQQDKACVDFQFEFNHKKYICELKPSENQTDIKYAIQDAIGQILRYAFDRNFDCKIIVFQKKPYKDNLRFLEYLKNEHNIYYLYEHSNGNFKGNALY